MIVNKHNKPELLSPAGSMDSLKAALSAGADAVYFGGTSFSNRMRAKNFDNSSLTDAIKLAHSCGAKAYVTINTRIRDREADDLLALADVILSGKNGPDSLADAIIIADFGAASLIKSRYPHAVLHASTQTSLSSLSDCYALAEAGFSRLVIPRELCENEIKKLSLSSPVELEMFIHGAHCVSLSGQCLLSYVMGGRSGNRGDCAQPCRLSYSFSDRSDKTCNSCRTPLSLADMCLAGNIANICSLGISSLKIEGRLKPAAYVYGVTKIYRRLLDEERNASPEEIRELSDLFSRGFTDSYFRRSYAKMSAVSSGTSAKLPAEGEILPKINAELNNRIASYKKSGAGKTPIKAKFILKSGAPAALYYSYGDVSAEVTGEIPSPAVGKALDFVSAEKSLSKLGETEFVLRNKDITFDMEDNLWLPTSALNDLRRRCAELLCTRLASGLSENNSDTKAGETLTFVSSGRYKISRGAPENTALLLNPYILSNSDADRQALFFSRFSRIYVPLALHNEIFDRLVSAGISREECYEKLCAYFPPIAPDDEKILAILRENCRCRRFLVHTIGQARLLRSLSNSPLFDFSVKYDYSFRTNITNTAALRFYESIDPDFQPEDIFASPELPSAAAAKLGCSVIAYGKLPLMTLSRCVISGGRCNRGGIGGRCDDTSRKTEKSKNISRKYCCSGYLTDRKGEKFFVISDSSCLNFVCNSVPVWMGDKLSEIKKCPSLMFYFTDESMDEILAVLNDYAVNIRRDGRRI